MATKTKTATKKQTKATKPAKAKATAKNTTGKMSQVDAALKVLAEARKMLVDLERSQRIQLTRVVRLTEAFQPCPIRKRPLQLTDAARSRR